MRLSGVIATYMTASVESEQMADRRPTHTIVHALDDVRDGLSPFLKPFRAVILRFLGGRARHGIDRAHFDLLPVGVSISTHLRQRAGTDDSMVERVSRKWRTNNDRQSSRLFE